MPTRREEDIVGVMLPERSRRCPLQPWRNDPATCTSWHGDDDAMFENTGATTLDCVRVLSIGFDGGVPLSGTKSNW